MHVARVQSSHVVHHCEPERLLQAWLLHLLRLHKYLMAENRPQPAGGTIRAAPICTKIQIDKPVSLKGDEVSLA